MTGKDFIERYGVTLGIVGILALVLMLVPGNKPASTTAAITEGAQAADLGADTYDGALDAGPTVDTKGKTNTGKAGAASVKGSAAPIDPAEAVSGAPATFDKALCREDRRLKGISHYMPPCMGFTKGYSGRNGGATARGITEKTVKLVLFASQSDPATTAILTQARLADAREDVERIYATLMRYANLHYQTWGREVVYQIYDASGPDSNDEAMKADAIKIASDIKPFAVIGGPKVFGEELVSRGVICICTVSLTSDFYNSHPPYFFGSLPTLTEYSINVAEYLGKRLKGKNAKWAGDEHNPTQGFKSKPRRFGLIYLEGANGRVDPEGRRFRNHFVAELAKYGVKLAAEESYLYDPGRNQSDITNMIAKFRAAGVTTVIGIVDPLSPIIITQEATRQGYYPEWLQTGTGLSDTTTAGRLYDQRQWSHSFGISPLWVTWTEKRFGPGYREYHHMRPGESPGREGNLIEIYRAPVHTLFRGVQMAGPKLTPETFAQGQFRYPRTGGIPTAPLVYLTRQYPTEIKDFVEIFYDADEPGKDERGESGRGMVMKVAGGKRYQAGKWPTTDPNVFNSKGAIAVTGDPKLLDPPHEKDGHKHTEKKKCLSCE